MPVQLLVPIFAYFLVGVLLRKSGVASREHALFLFRLILFVTLPALVFTTISVTDLALNSLVLPMVGFLVNLVCACIALVYARMMMLERAQTGAVIVAAGITNMVVMFPFIHASLGLSALADAVLYDVGNSAFVTTVAYAVSSRYGEAAAPSVWVSVGKTLRSPLFLALFAAIGVSMWSVEVPGLLNEILTPLGAATMPLILIALGASFSTTRLGDSIVYSTVSIRMVGGLLAASFFVYAFDLQGLTAITVIAAGAAPIGFNSVTLASVGKLDIEHATASLSASVAIGLVTTSVIVLLGARWLGSTA
jgi:predicted permease